MTREHDDASAATLPSPAVACSLTTAELRARRDELRAAFAGSIARVAELPDGYRLELAPRAGLLATVAHFIELERACCPFLSFILTAPAESGPVTVAITGPEGTKEFFAAAVTERAADLAPDRGCCGGGCA